MRSIRAAIEWLRPCAVVVVRDSGIPAFRRELVPEYKLAREKKREEEAVEERKNMRWQMAMATKLMHTAGFRVLRYAGWEADDVIAAAARLLDERGYPSTVMSGDRDLIQLLNLPSVRWFDYRSKCIVPREDVVERYGVQLSEWVLFRLLQGDKSDGIPGVKGCGAVWAKRLIEACGAWLSQNSPGRALGLLRPEDQICLLHTYLESKESKSRVEEAVYASHQHLFDTVRVIDLSRNGFRAGDKFFQGLFNAPPFDRDEFKRLCRKLHFRSFLDDMPAWRGVLGGIAKRRSKITSELEGI
jgi:5'-3' exonuclease